jgi:DNA-binding beta-propeller fold protein YncE
MVFDPAAAEPGTQRPFLYVADALQNTIHVVDLNRNVEIAALSTQWGTKVRSLAITPDGRTLFVANEGSVPNGTIGIFDVSDLSVRNPNAFRRRPHQERSHAVHP